MEKLRTYYLAGWLKSESMTREDWKSEWLKTVVEAEQNDQELVVFRVPKKRNGVGDSEMIGKIEKSLQKKFGKP